MFKAIFLQRFYNISDEQLEFQITDRYSFTNFLGLHGVSKILDFTTFWKFRDALATKGIERELFDLFHAGYGAIAAYLQREHNQKRAVFNKE